MVPNKTEEQLFIEQFKYYDLDGFGDCNLPNFIKSNERIGVILSKLNDLEKVFKYFDKYNRGLINYKQLANDIFKQKNNNFYQSTNNDFIIILDKILIRKGKCKILFNLIKSLQIFDINNTKRLNIDDFLRVINGLNLGISLNDIQTLYSSNYLFSNGMVNYQNIIQNLLEIYWNSNRDILSYKLYNILTNNEQKLIYFDNLKDIYRNTYLDQYLNWEIEIVLDQYKNITKIYEGSQLLHKEIKQFIFYFGYGINNDQQLEDLLFNFKKIFNKDLLNKKVEKKEIPKKKKIIYSENSVEDALLKLRKYLWRFGRKTLFNFIVNFRFFDKDLTKFISRYDFLKLLKTFSFHLDESSIEILFDRYGDIETKNVLNYEKLLKSLSAFSTNQNREFAILDAYESIKKRAKDNLKSIDIPYIKYLYNATNNFFNPDEPLNRIDFYDCLELYHGSYKFYGIEKFLPEEFFEFYRFISIIIEDDNIFINMLEQEWSPRLFNKANVSDNIKECHIIEKNSDVPKLKDSIKQKKENREEEFINYENKNNNNLVKNKEEYIKYFNNNDSIEKLRNILKKRGVRGLLYLQKELISKSKDINKITYELFLDALNSQRIILNNNDNKKIFIQFDNNGYLDFNQFIREFKKELSSKKLDIVGAVYEKLDINNNEKVPLETIKISYNSDNHPDVLNGKINSEEKMLEFIDCFDLNLNLLNYQFNRDNNYINFELFANFYEYVAFIYDNDKQFENILQSTWN